jgi:hypothetical protein
VCENENKDGVIGRREGAVNCADSPNEDICSSPGRMERRSIEARIQPSGGHPPDSEAVAIFGTNVISFPTVY